MSYGFVTIYRRDMMRFFRFRTQLISSLIQPALWLAFFGVAMSGNFDRLGALMPTVPGVEAISYLTFMAAGVIAMTTLFTSLFGGFVLLFDKNWGLMREMMASPMPRRDIIIGIALSGMTKSWIQTTIIIVFGLFIGVDFFTGYSLLEAVLAYAGILMFVGMFAVGFLCLSATIALSMESPEGFQGITTLLTMPLFFVSNALYPTTAFPKIMQDLAALNPLTYLITGVRYFAIGNDFMAIGIHFQSTPTEIILSFIALLIFTSVMFAIAWRTVEKAVIT